MKRFLGIITAGFLATPVLGAEGAYASGAPDNKTIYFVAVVFVAGFIMALAEIFAVRAQAKAIETALKAIARQPNAVKSIQTNLIIGLALIESLAIYVLLIALILLFLNPFTGFFS